MESLFFNLDGTHYQRSVLHTAPRGRVEQIDISNGMVLLCGKLETGTFNYDARFVDAAVVVVAVKTGTVEIETHEREITVVGEGRSLLGVSGRMDFSVRWYGSSGCEAFVLFVADFFIKRYVTGEAYEPVDRLWASLREAGSFETLDTLPLDPLSDYLVYHTTQAERFGSMRSLRAELAATEYLVRRLELWEVQCGVLSQEERRIAQKARAVLLREFLEPPSIGTLARRCATNTTKLKRVFKEAYGVTVYAYVRRLRMQEAMALLTKSSLRVSDVARRVGYRHSGHFSKLFYREFGISPKLAKRAAQG